MKLVICNNRVVGYGENLISMGGTVIDAETGAVYQSATIAECDCVPSDLDSVGYEYRNGNFVRCGPFGVGDGTVALWCSAGCKTPRDSGIPFSQMVQQATTEYTGSGGRTVSLSFDFVVDMLLIFSEETNDYNEVTGDFAIVTPVMATTFIYDYDNSFECHLCNRYKLNLAETGETITWKEDQSNDPRNHMNAEGVSYKVVAFGHREV